MAIKMIRATIEFIQKITNTIYMGSGYFPRLNLFMTWLLKKKIEKEKDKLEGPADKGCG